MHHLLVFILSLACFQTALACEIKASEVKKHFESQLEEPSVVEEGPYRIGPFEANLLTASETCHRQGCEHAVYLIEKGCAKVIFATFAHVFISKDGRELTQRTNSLPVDNLPEQVVKYHFDDGKRTYLPSKR